MEPRQQTDRILVGTASWSDPGFVEHWYPPGMAAGDRLSWYAQQFEMVEVNSSFYSMPDRRMVERWCRSTPEPFMFNVKLHQLLSRHATAAKLLPLKLRAKAEQDGSGKVKLSVALEKALLQEFITVAETFRSFGKLGVLLLQLSPAFSPRKHRLEELDEVLGSLGDFEVAVEFRNRNWVEEERADELLRYLRGHSATLVSVDVPDEKHFTIMPTDLDEVTNPRVAYLRLHGRDARAYTTGKTVAARFNYDYSDVEIKKVAERVRRLKSKAQQVHVVFNNNALDYAPHAALRMRAALGQVVASVERQPKLL